MLATGKAKTVIWRWQERFGEEGLAGLWRVDPLLGLSGWVLFSAKDRLFLAGN